MLPRGHRQPRKSHVNDRLKRRLVSARSSNPLEVSPSDAENILDETGKWSHVTAESLWYSLKPKIAYLSTDQLAEVEDALIVAYVMHHAQRRKSGEPCVSLLFK